MRTLQMRRRDVIRLIGAAAAWPAPGLAQQPGRVPIVGFLSPNSATAAQAWTGAFVQRLRELGWNEGRTVQIEYRFENGEMNRTAEFVEDLVRLKVDVVVTHGAPNIAAARKATSTIPIIFALATDPIGSGFVDSLSRPGGNLTGLSIQARDLAAKRLELMREISPGLKRLAILGDSNASVEIKEAEAAAVQMGIEPVTTNVHQADEIAPAITSLKGKIDALYVCSTPFINTNRVSIGAIALAAQLPTIYGFREAVDSGGLVSYGPNFPDLFRRAAHFVDKILRAAKPNSIPVEQPTKFDLVVNLKTAKALNLRIPGVMLTRAEEVIE